MTRKWSGLFLLSGVLAAVCPAALAEEPQKAFDALFGEDARKAAMTTDTKDDVALAARILVAARELKDDPKVQAYFREKAYEFGIKGPGGYTTAIDAMKLLAQSAPLRTAECRDKILAVIQLQFTRGAPAERLAAGEALIDQHLLIAEAKLKEGKTTDATTAYNEALVVARKINSKRAGDIQGKIDAIANRIKLEQRITGLEAEIKNNPDNKSAFRALLMIYLVEMDKPDEAARYLDPELEEALRTYVPLAGKDPKEVPEAGCLGLGDWYRSLATGAKPAAKPAMLLRAKGWYERYLEVHRKQDASGLKVKVELEKLTKELDELGVPKALLAALTPTLSLDLGSGVTMKLVLVKPGKFTMGSPVTDRRREASEVPHEVTLTRNFYVGATEVTQGQYEAVMGRNPGAGGAEYPVMMVSWNDAVAFCQRMTAKVGKTVRLPTEAEWEYSCRAGTKERYFFGDDERELTPYAWYILDSDSRIHSAGRKKPNPLGLYDTCGNVWEWCSDWSAELPKDPATDPTGPATGTERVVRGGSATSMPGLCRSPARSRMSPDTRQGLIGFRVVVEPK